MRIPAYFSKWYWIYGLLDETFARSRGYHAAERIAWRAYRKGKRDERVKWHQRLGRN